MNVKHGAMLELLTEDVSLSCVRLEELLLTPASDSVAGELEDVSAELRKISAKLAQLAATLSTSAVNCCA
jgi:hypothetical protein